MSLSRVCSLAILPIAGTFLFAVPAHSASLSQSTAAPLAASASSEPLLLCAPGQESVQKDGLGLYATRSGMTLLPVKAGQQCKLLATAAGLNVQFEGQPALSLAGPISYRLDQTPRRVDISLAEPILCESYYTDADRLAVQVTDTNGVAQPLRGFSGLNYSPATSRFSPAAVAGTYGPAVQCYGFPFASLTTNPPSVPVPPVVDPNRIFSSGFDDGANLKLELLTGDGSLAIRELEVARDQPFSYRIRISNTGALAANGVRVREFVPTAAGQSVIQPVVTAHGWTCTSSQGVCSGGVAGSGALGQAGISLAAGEVRTYTLSREVSSGAPPQRTLLAAALFFNPEDAVGGGDAVRTDNSAPLILKLVPNQAPQFACSYPDRSFSGEPSVWNNDLPVAVIMNEGQAPVEFECRVRDPDVEAFTLAASPTNDNPTLINSAGLVTPLAADRFDVRIQVPGDQIGTGLVTQTATDVREATGRVRVSVEVRDVNAPPSFDLLSNELRLYPGPFDGPIRDDSDQMIPKALYVLGDDCRNGQLSTCTVSFQQFLANVSAGAAPESPNQQVAPSITCSGSGLLSGGVASVTPTGPNPTTSEFGLQFVHYKTQSGFFNPSAVVTCDIKLTDTGTPPLDSPVQTLTLRFQNAP